VPVSVNANLMHPNAVIADKADTSRTTISFGFSDAASTMIKTSQHEPLILPLPEPVSRAILVDKQ